MSDRSGQIVRGYRLISRLGSGGFGEVYLAHQQSVNREVAIKVILPEYANHPDFIRRFENEAQLIARLEHPFIVPLFDYWRDPTGAYLVMRYLRGGSLHGALEKGPFDIQAAARLLEQQAAALTVAHRSNVVHRDIKPGNILLDEDGNTYLADFGIAKNLRTSDTSESDTIIGSPSYLSPEQIRSDNVTIQSDIYSLGVVLYEILIGEKPFGNLTPTNDVLMKQLNDPMPSLHKQRPDLPRELDPVLQTATDKNPAHRYTDAVRFAAAFRAVIAVAPLKPSQPIAEPLTGREQEIIQLMVEGLSNQEIAQKLYLSTGTVKWYVKQLFSKLDVHSRWQAVTKALELGLAVDKNADPVPSSSAHSNPPFMADESTVLFRIIQHEDIENPYKGLRAFQEADAPDFFGRNALVANLLARMSETGEYSRFLAVVGPSGGGKSSVVRAGLLPALRQGMVHGSNHWYIIDMLPGSNPIAKLEAALLSIAVKPPAHLIEQLRADQRGLLWAVDNLLVGMNGDLLLVIDQFEEVFTLVDDEAERAHFLNLIYTAIIDPLSRLRVVITLRADFYDRPLLYEHFGALMQMRTQVVLPLNADEIERVINGPAERVGVPVDTELVAAVVADVREEPGALPLLEYALTEAFERREGSRLTLTDYRASGGVLGALARRAEEVFLELEPAQQAVAQHVFLRLVTLGEGTEDTRRRVRRSELNGLADASIIDGVLDEYSKYRLLTFDREIVTREPTVEVAHEALLREWGRLREWLDGNRADVRLQRLLADAASEWDKADRDPSFLLSGNKLRQFEEWALATRVALTQEEQNYYEASIAARAQLEEAEAARRSRDEAVARRVQNFQRVTLVMGAVGLLSVLAALVAAGIASSATAEYNTANLLQRTATVAEGQAIAAQGTAQAQAQAANTAAVSALNLAQTATLAQGNALAAGATARAQAEGANLAATNALNSAATATVAQGQAEAQAAGARADFAQAAQRLTPIQSTLIAAGTEIAGAQAQVLDLGAQLTPISLTLTPVQLTLEAGGQQIATANYRVDQANEQLSGANTQVAQSGATLTPLPLTLTPARATLEAGQRQIVEAQGTAQRAAVAAGLAENRADSAGTQVALAAQTLTPVHATLQSGGTQVADAQTQVAGAGQTLTPVSPTLTAVALEVQGQQSLIESLRLAGAANGVLLDNGNAPIAVLLSVRALNTAYSPQADASLAQALERLYTQQVFEGSSSWVLSVAFSPDGNQILMGTNNGTTQLWDVATNEQLTLFSTGAIGIPVNSVAFSPDGTQVLTGSEDGTVRLWDTTTGEQLHQYLGQSAEVNTVAFSPDGSKVVGGSKDGVAYVWDTVTEETLQRLEGHGGWVMSAVFSPDGTHILTSSRDDNLRLWDVETGELVQPPLEGHTDDVWTAAFSPDGRQIVSGGVDDNVRVWDAASGETTRILVGHIDDVWSVAFSPDGTQILSGSKDDTVRLWDAATGDVLRVFSDPEMNFVNSVAFSPNGTRILTGSDDGAARLWNVAAASAMPVFAGHDKAVTSLAVSADGQMLLTASRDTTAVLWDSASGQLFHTLRGHTGGVTSAAIAPDAATVVTGSQDDTAIIWDVSSGQRLHILAGHENAITSVAYSPDGQSIVTGSEDGTAAVWETATGQRLHVLSGSNSPITSVVFSPDGTMVLAGNWGQQALLWDIQTGTILNTLVGHNGYVTSVAFSPDGSQILTGSRDRSVRLWDRQTGQQLQVLMGHAGWITSVAFSPDGLQILSGSRDRTARLWDLETLQVIRLFAGSESPVTSIAFTPDGDNVLTGSEDGVARLWSIDWHAMVSYACTRVFRDFTDEERRDFIIPSSSPTCAAFNRS